MDRHPHRARGCRSEGQHHLARRRKARNVAARLGEVAVPGQIVCTEVAQRLFRGQYLCVSLADGLLKGVSQPLELFQVQSIAAADSHAALPAELSPLTGGDLEISLLKERWEQAQEGMGKSYSPSVSRAWKIQAGTYDQAPRAGAVCRG